MHFGIIRVRFPVFALERVKRLPESELLIGLALCRDRRPTARPEWRSMATGIALAGSCAGPSQGFANMVIRFRGGK